MEPASGRDWLRDGIAGASAVEVRNAVGLPDDASDFAVAAALVAMRVEDAASRCALDASSRSEDLPADPPVKLAADSSFLGQLGTEALDVGRITDVRTLLAILRGGSSARRRAALRVLVEKLGAREDSAQSDALRRAVVVVAELRDDDLTYELCKAREGLPAAVGRVARAERDATLQLAARTAPDIDRFWRGDGVEEPLRGLAADSRAQVLVRLRELPASWAIHVSALIEGSDPGTTAAVRRELLVEVRDAADPRLVPALAAILARGPKELMREAARVLGRIDDPRVRPVLVSALAHGADPADRVVFAGALGLTGDARGAPDVRAALESKDRGVLCDALEAMEAVGTTKDSEAVLVRLRDTDPAVVQRAVRALRRIGDSRALGALLDLRERSGVSGSLGEVDDAVVAVRARMELTGEDATGAPKLSIWPVAIPAARRSSLRAILSGLRHYVTAWILRTFGASERAVRRFELAAAVRPGWGAPLVAMAMLYAGREADAPALACLRRALEADRLGVERNPWVMRVLGGVFLRRADALEREGRAEIALGLLEEALAVDLRRAPSAVAAKIRRRHELLRARQAS